MNNNQEFCLFYNLIDGNYYECPLQYTHQSGKVVAIGDEEISNFREKYPEIEIV